MTTNLLPLLICSLGNPGAAYASTLHSAGHTVLQTLSTLLQPQTPAAFTKERDYGNALVTRTLVPATSSVWTLCQCPTFMNLSGKGVAGAYRAWVREQSLSSATTATATTGRLVVLHDELEKPLGSVTVREQQGLSAKGHNGIKSCLASLGNIPFVRVGVGIGRPLSREPDHVASYVLKKMTPGERQKVEAAAREVMTRLMALKGTR